MQASSVVLSSSAAAPAKADADGSLDVSRSAFVVAEVVAEALFRMTGNRVNLADWEDVVLPNHLRINFRVVDDNDKTLAQGFDLEALKQTLKHDLKNTIKKENKTTL